MYVDSIFRICLIVSISVHICLLLPWPFLDFLSKPEIPFQKIEMTYFNEKEISRPAIRDIKPAAATNQPVTPPEIKSSDISSAAKTAAGHGVSEPASAKKEEEQKPIKEVGVKKEEKPNNAAAHIEEKRDRVEIIEIGAQKGVVYEKYYFDVREKIRSIIEKNKRGVLKESEVCVRFIVDRNGALKDLYLYKSSGPDAGSLERLAVKSIKEASPFPPFTDRIKEGELQFNLPIRVIRRY